MMIESLTGRKFQSNGNERYGEELIEIDRYREEREREESRKIFHGIQNFDRK